MYSKKPYSYILGFLIAVILLSFPVSVVTSSKLIEDKLNERVQSQLNTIEDYDFAQDDSVNENRIEQRKIEHSSELPAITVLCYHEVDSRYEYSDDPLNVQPWVFHQHLQELKNEGYTFIDVNDLMNYEAGVFEMPEKPVMITFDDGYVDNYLCAFPILRAEQAKATFFVVTDHIGNDNRMTEKQIKRMAKEGMAFGSHTVSHEPLNNLSEEEIEYQLKKSKEDLEEIIGEKVYALAYPGGKINQKVVGIAERNYNFSFIASIEPYQKETFYTINRYGVFRWNQHIGSIFKNNQ